MFCYPDKYKLGIHAMSKVDVVEIDSINELIAVDPTYKLFTLRGEENDK